MGNYNGTFLGGPDNRNYVLSDTPTVAVVTITKLYLDDKSVTVRATRGNYIWQEQGNYFKWKLTSLETYTKPI